MEDLLPSSLSYHFSKIAEATAGKTSDVGAALGLASLHTIRESLERCRDALVLLAHTTNCVEHPELVAERILRYARMVGRENVIAGADCGFAQGLATARVHPSVMWEKFRMLAEGARLASQRLWN